MLVIYKQPHYSFIISKWPKYKIGYLQITKTEIWLLIILFIIIFFIFFFKRNVVDFCVFQQKLLFHGFLD